MLLRFRAATMVAALAIATYAACSHDNSDSTNDGGTLGHKPGVDAGGVATDGGVSDADGSVLPYGDAGGVPDPFSVGTWKHGVQSLPDCNLQIAADPATTPGPLTWSACPSGHAGCQVMVADWSTRAGAKLYTNRPEPVRLVNGNPYLIYTREYPYGGSFGALMQVVQPLRGSPVLAVGSANIGDASGWCIAASSVGDYGMAYVSLGNTTSTAYELDWSTWASPSTFSYRVFTGTDVPIGNEYGIGATDIALGPAALMDFSNQAIHKVTGLPAGDSLDLPVMVPSGAFAVEQIPAGNIIALLGLDASISTIVDPTASSRSVSWLAVDRASSNALVWVESDSSDLTSNPIIWTSPYATTSASITRREVAAFQDTSARGGADSVSNAGVMLNLTGDTTALLTRLSDGMGWSISAEPGMYFVQPLWADDTEVWILASSYGPHDADRILRLQRSSMGVPTVARGF